MAGRVGVWAHGSFGNLVYIWDLSYLEVDGHDSLHLIFKPGRTLGYVGQVTRHDDMFMVAQLPLQGKVIWGVIRTCPFLPVHRRG